MNASIIHNTNRAISAANANFQNISTNSLIKFADDEVCYTVSLTRSFLYIKDFKVIKFNQISVSEDVGINLSVGDTLGISYKEYALKLVKQPIESGTAYRKGDILEFKGGVPTVNVFNGVAQRTSVEVASVDEKGGITKVKLNNKGRYIVEPGERVEVSGGAGSGAVLEVLFVECDDRTVVERTIKEVKTNQETLITIDAPIFTGVTEGKLSVKKWEIYLTSNYTGKSVVNLPCFFIKDFTPEEKLPLLSQNSANIVSVFNQAMLKIDQKFSHLEKLLAEKDLTG